MVSNAPVRFVVEFTSSERGQVEGFVRRDGDAANVAFSGWLDLLRALELEPPQA